MTESHSPTPEEIAQRAAEIRAGWTEKERRKRSLRKPPPWEAPQVPAVLIFGESDCGEK